MISRIDAIEVIAKHITTNDLVISTTGMISREMFVIEDRPANFYMLGSMGLASSFGLGLAAINSNQRVIVIEGDGSALMSMGTLALVASEAPDNFVHIVLDNECYESTGGQPSISSQINLSEIAKSSGYPHVTIVENGKALSEVLSECESKPSPHFILAKVDVASLEEIPRVSHAPTEIRDLFKSAVATQNAR